MIGRNTFNFNTATMMEAVQEYLDKRAPGLNASVTGIVPASGNTFIVSTEPKPNSLKDTLERMQDERAGRTRAADERDGLL